MAGSSEAQNHIQRAKQFMNYGKYFAASAEYEKAFSADPADTRTLAELADTYSHRRIYAEAADTCLKIFRLDYQRSYKPFESKDGSPWETINLAQIWANACQKLKAADLRIRLTEFEALS